MCIRDSVLEGYAEYYSADLSEKVVRGMTENALKSKYNGGTLPIGYQTVSYTHLDVYKRQGLGSWRWPLTSRTVPWAFWAWRER